MGEEAKKPTEEKKMEEKKLEEEEASKKQAPPEGEKKPEKPPEKSEDPPAAEKDPKENPKEPKEEEKKKPQEIVLKVYMHCEGCARKVRRCLKGFEGVEDVMTDCKSSKVVVKGEKADPLKVLERVQRKSHRQVELLTPVPEPKPAGEPEKKPDEKEKPKAEEKKEEVVTVVLRVHMHCEACAMEIQKRIQKMKGVESVEPDFKASQVTVKGVFSPAKLVEYVYRRTGKHAAVIKQDPPPKPEKKDNDAADKKGKDEPKAEKKPDGEPKEDTKQGGDAAKETKDGGGGGGGEAKPAVDGGGAAASEEETTKVVELKRNEYYYAPRYPMEMYAYPPQIFSDENPNACTVM